eukprot:4050344-Prymnesium_polylepis.1
MTHGWAQVCDFDAWKAKWEVSSAPPAPMSHSSLTRVRLSIMSGAVNANKLPGKLISSGFPAASGAVSNEPTASAVSTVVIL